MPVRHMTWGEAFRIGTASFVVTLVLYSVAWLSFAAVLDEILPPAGSGTGAGAGILVLGMVVEMVIGAAVIAASIDAPLVDADSRMREYSRARVAFGAAVTAYLANVLAWFIIAAVLVWEVWHVPGYDWMSWPATLEYFAARQFGTATLFWIASASLYAVLSTFMLKIFAGRKRVLPPARKRKRKWGVK